MSITRHHHIHVQRHQPVVEKKKPVPWAWIVRLATLALAAGTFVAALVK